MKTQSTTRHTTFRIITVIAILTTITACSQQPAKIMTKGPVLNTNQKTNLTPQQVLEKMAQTYAKCNSYQDQGTVQTVYHEKSRQWVTKQPFKTAFIRPDRFRYQFRETYQFGPPDLYIVQADATGIRTWWTVQKRTKTEESLGMALGGATGVSGGSAYIIPTLLLPDIIKGYRFTEMTNLEFLHDGIFDDRLCFRIHGTFANKVPTTLWIDADSFLVRRIDKTNTFPEFKAETTTTYDTAEINTKPTDADLAFNPPNQ